MNELLKIFGLELFIDEISIKVQTFQVVVEESNSITLTTSSTWTLGGNPIVYRGFWVPTIVWNFQTEFGQQLEKYNAAHMPTYTLPYGLSQGISGISSVQLGQAGQMQSSGSYPWGGLASSLGGTVSSGAALQGQLAQKQSQISQLQQQISQAHSQLSVPMIPTPYCPPGQIIMQSPTSQVVIKNVQDVVEEEKKSWIQRVKDWANGTTS